MKYKHTTTFLVILYSLLLMSCNQEPRVVHQIPIEDFFRNPDKSSMRLSPDGKKIAYTKNFQNRSNIFVEDLQSHQITQITFDTIRGVNRYIWLNDNRLLYLFDRNGSEDYHLFSVSSEGKNPIDLTPFENVKMQLLDLSKVEGDEIYIALNKRNAEIFDLYKLNVNTGALKMVQENKDGISYWMEDLQGRITLAIAGDGVGEKLLYRPHEGKEFKELIKVGYNETFYPLHFCPNGTSVYALSNIGRDKTALVIYDLLENRESKVVFEHSEVDVTGAEFSNLTNMPLYANFSDAKSKIQFLDKRFDQMERQCKRSFASQSYFIVNFSDRENSCLIKSYSDKNIGSFWLYNFDDNSLEKICDLAPWLDESELCEMTAIRFKARDGLQIEGYLTLPKSKNKRYPLIVNPHGGPWVRNRWSFSPEVQFFSNRGYAVLQVNYRGSEGYGKKFFEAGFKEIGRKMQDDITDGVYHLINQGIVDSNRIGIYGFSFGGYFALNGVIQDSGLYQCAASYCGIPNLYSYIKEVPPYQKQYLQILYEMIGNPETDPEYFRSYSPIFHTDKIKVPVFIAQGERDTRVSVEDVNIFVKTLKKENVSVNYLLVKNEGHGFQKEENKFSFYRELESFFEENLMNR